MKEITYKFLVTARDGKQRTLFFRTEEQDENVAIRRVEQSQRVTVDDVEIVDA